VLVFQNELQSRRLWWKLRQHSQKTAKGRLTGGDDAADGVICSSCIKEHGQSPALRNDVTSSAACSLDSAATSSVATPSQRSCRSARVAGAASLYRRASSSSSHLCCMHYLTASLHRQPVRPVEMCSSPMLIHIINML